MNSRLNHVARHEPPEYKGCQTRAKDQPGCQPKRAGQDINEFRDPAGDKGLDEFEEAAGGAKACPNGQPLAKAEIAEACSKARETVSKKMLGLSREARVGTLSSW